MDQNKFSLEAPVSKVRFMLHSDYFLFCNTVSNTSLLFPQVQNIDWNVWKDDNTVHTMCILILQKHMHSSTFSCVHKEFSQTKITL